MLVFRESDEGIWVDHTYRGAAIKLQIRPRNAAMVEQINKKNSKFEMRYNPVTKQDEKISVTDYEANTESILDYILQSFSDVVLESGEPLAVNRKNKIRLAFLPPDPGEKLLFDFIIEKAKEFELVKIAENADAEKN